MGRPKKNTGAPGAAEKPAGSGETAGKTIWKFEAPQAGLRVILPEGLGDAKFVDHVYQTDNPRVAELIKTRTKGVRLLETFTLEATGGVRSRQKRDASMPWKVSPVSEDWHRESRCKAYATKAEAEAAVASYGDEAQHYVVDYIDPRAVGTGDPSGPTQ